jgi:Uma2 family endonuclease
MASKEFIYPTSDGQPMAEGDWHLNVMIYLILGLGLHFRNQPDVYVAGNNFLYYKEGDPTKRISPDVYVVFGVGNQVRDCYKVWEEDGKRPTVVFEITSPKTQGEDTRRKRRIYERGLQVPEYFLFDSKGDYLHPRLQGYRLVEGQYVTLKGEGNRLHSDLLNMDLIPEGAMLRLYDPVRGRYLLTLLEEHERAEQARARVQEHQARLQAEARAERLAARLRELGLFEEEL